MARKRMIDPNFWVDEKLGTCDPMARLTFMGLISQADDEGRLNGHPALLKSVIYPYDTTISVEVVEGYLVQLAEKKLIKRYTVDGQSYIMITNFSKHQTINKKSESKLPPPEEIKDDYGSPTVVLPPKRREKKRREEKRREENVQTAVAVADDIRKLIGLFKTVNPNYERLYANTSQRDALKRMVNKHTYEKVEKSILFVCEVYGKQYAPQITTPLQLEQKMGQLIAYARSRTEGVPKIAVQT